MLFLCPFLLKRMRHPCCTPVLDTNNDAPDWRSGVPEVEQETWPAEQCAEVDFTREVASAGGEEGAEALRVCLAVGRALNDRLLACVQEAASPTVRRRSAPTARFCPVHSW